MSASNISNGVKGFSARTAAAAPAALPAGAGVRREDIVMFSPRLRVNELMVDVTLSAFMLDIVLFRVRVEVEPPKVPGNFAALTPRPLPRLLSV
jgi:hypothetical protein